MKTKGITPIERHAEKILVGVFALLALGVIALQFVGSPNNVTVPNAGELPPASAYAALRARAEQVQGRLADPNPAQGIPETVPDMTSQIAELLSPEISPRTARLPVPLGPVTGEVGINPAELQGAARYAQVEPPAPRDPIVRGAMFTLDPLVVARSEALQEVVTEQPYDIQVISIQAEYPAADLRAALEADPDGSGPLAALPRTSWLGRAAILDVQVERQRRLPDGSFSEPVLLPPEPLYTNFRDLLDMEDMTRGEFTNLSRRARENAEQIVQPRFYTTIAGPEWRPPSAAARSTGPVRAEQPARIRSLVNRLDNLQRELETLRARDPQSVRVPRLERDIADVEQALVEAGYEGESAAASASAGDATLSPVGPLESLERLDLIAHDITASPGETYRYRIRVALANPLYGYQSSLEPDQQGLALSPAIFSEFSPWTAPIAAQPMQQVFITTATGPAEGALGGLQTGGVSADLYRFYYGHWRRATLRLRPGDALAATIPAPAAPLFTIEETEGGATAAEDPGVQITGETPGPERIVVGLPDGMVLDVMPESAAAGPQGRVRYIAVISSQQGRIETRDPDSDRSHPAKQAADRSAESGANTTLRNVPSADGRRGAGRG